MNTTRKAEVTTIAFGNTQIEGLRFTDTENIEFGVAIPQIASQFLDDQNQASKTIKRLLGKDFKATKAKTEFNRNYVNVVSLKDYEKIIFRLALKGNAKAISFSEDLIGLSLHQLFCDAFKIKFEAEDRQEWLKIRQTGKETRKTLTDAIRDYCQRNNDDLSVNYKKWIFNNATDAVNQGVFDGRRARELKRDWQIDGDVREHFSKDELRWVEQVEDLAMRTIEQDNVEPIQSVKYAISVLKIQPVKR